MIPKMSPWTPRERPKTRPKTKRKIIEKKAMQVCAGGKPYEHAPGARRHGGGYVASGGYASLLKHEELSLNSEEI